MCNKSYFQAGLLTLIVIKPIEMENETSRQLCTSGLLMITIFYIFTGSVSAQKESDRQQWITLFNGKDIKDWIVKINHHDTGEDPARTFRVEDGIVKVRYDKYDTFNQQYGHRKTINSLFLIII